MNVKYESANSGFDQKDFQYPISVLILIKIFQYPILDGKL